MSLASIYTTRCIGADGGGLETFLPPARTTFFGFARQALAEALRRAGVAPGDAVLLPGFICREVLASLAEVGAVPRYYDVDETLRTDEAALDRAAPVGARAVVAVNYFGFPQPLGAFRRWTGRVGAVLIEDNAHGLLSADGSVPLGQRGDFGLFSFRKTLAVPNGAALVDRRPGDVSSPASSYIRSPRRAEWRFRTKTAMRLVMSAVGVQRARVLIDSVRLVRRVLTGSKLPRSAAVDERMMPDEALAPLTTRLLASLDVDAERERRRVLYGECRQRFAGVDDVRLIFDDLAPGVVPQGFPFFFTGTNPERFITRWWRESIPMIRWPDLPSAIVAGAPDHYRRAMLVPFLW
jgi:hypothetical protein